jgi:hypothetical protein
MHMAAVLQHLCYKRRTRMLSLIVAFVAGQPKMCHCKHTLTLLADLAEAALPLVYCA